MIFTAPLGTPTIGGFGPGQHDLFVSVLNPGGHTWLRADFVHPSSGAGIYFGGTDQLTAYDGHDSVIASLRYGGTGSPFFIGIVSEIPIAYVIADSGGSSETILDFIFNPVPEPASALLFALGTLLAVGPRRLRP